MKRMRYFSKEGRCMRSGPVGMKGMIYLVCLSAIYWKTQNLGKGFGFGGSYRVLTLIVCCHKSSRIMLLNAA